MNLDITIQNLADTNKLPTEENMKTYIKAAIMQADLDAEMTVRIVDEAESQQLNAIYRHKNKPTNVLAFPYQMPGYLGDLAICAPVVVREANEQGKSLEAHWAHMLVHGTLHLQGYDHEIDSERAVMEALEIKILTSLNFQDPYEEEVS